MCWPVTCAVTVPQTSGIHAFMSVSIAAHEGMPPLAGLYSRHAPLTCKHQSNFAVGCLVTILLVLSVYVSVVHLVVIERRLQLLVGRLLIYV